MEKVSGFFGKLPDRAEQEIVLPSGRKITILETTGADESTLSKGIKNNPAQGINKFLSRVTKNLDGKEGSVSEDEFKKMLSGDRTAMILKIRILTHGAHYKYNLKCTECGTDGEFEIDLDNMVAEIKPYPHGDEREFFVECDGHKLFFQMPDGLTEEKSLQNKDLDINKRINAMRLWEVGEKGPLPVAADNLKSRHIALLRKRLKEVECEMDNIAQLDCQNCGTRHAANVTEDVSFLFPNMT